MIKIFDGHAPQIASGVYVAETAAVIGQVKIGRGSSIWFGAVLRGDVMAIAIGDETSIQDNAVLHVTGGVSGTIVGDRVTVGHGAIVHACTVGNDCIIGMGSVLLDRAVIGAHCIIGAGAVVTPGTIIPDGSLVVGSPARVKREVTAAERVWIRESAAHYVALAAKYRDAP